MVGGLSADICVDCCLVHLGRKCGCIDWEILQSSFTVSENSMDQ